MPESRKSENADGAPRRVSRSPEARAREGAAAEELAQAEPTPEMSFAEFLESAPPNRLVTIPDLVKRQECSILSIFYWRESSESATEARMNTPQSCPICNRPASFLKPVFEEMELGRRPETSRRRCRGCAPSYVRRRITSSSCGPMISTRAKLPNPRSRRENSQVQRFPTCAAIG